MGQTVITIGPAGTVEDWVDTVFYGVRQNTVTGAASIDKISGTEVVSLPDQYTTRENDYVNWMWTTNTFQFSWGAQGRLLMEVL